MDTKTSNTQLEVNAYSAAMGIVDLFEKLGFTTDSPVDPVELKKEISGIIEYYMVQYYVGGGK